MKTRRATGDGADDVASTCCSSLHGLLAARRGDAAPSDDRRVRAALRCPVARATGRCCSKRCTAPSDEGTSTALLAQWHVPGISAADYPRMAPLSAPQTLGFSTQPRANRRAPTRIASRRSPRRLLVTKPSGLTQHLRQHHRRHPRRRQTSVPSTPASVSASRSSPSASSSRSHCSAGRRGRSSRASARRSQTGPRASFPRQAQGRSFKRSYMTTVRYLCRRHRAGYEASMTPTLTAERP